MQRFLSFWASYSITCFELAGASSYRGLELPGVRVIEGKIIIKIDLKGNGNCFEFGGRFEL